MQVSFTSRHGNVPESVRRLAEELLQRVERFEKRPATAHVSFDSEGGEKRVETRVSVAGHPPYIAHAAASSYRTALDQSIGRIVSQLKKEHDRYTDHQATKPLRP
jgi:ribosomal subunit interface protein